jgi:hypothetical protein
MRKLKGEYSICPRTRPNKGLSMQIYDPDSVSDTFPGDGWQRPALCGPNSGNCVEINLGNDGLVALRDSKLSDSPVLVFDDAEWDAFLNSARSGQFRR